MTTTCARCTTDEDYAKVSSFLIERRHDLHLSYMTMDMVTLLYNYITEGHLLQITNDEGDVLAAGAYYHGTPEHNFLDKGTVLVDFTVFDQAVRGTRLFLKGLKYLVEAIRAAHPEVQEIRMAAFADNVYVCNLYAKFNTSSYTRQGEIGEEIIFCSDLDSLWTRLQKFDRLNLK
ncbi:hypothetical protein C2I18_18830 [Paenibacillus sp. PK3_47]|uniref:hypothetical protein n=1 Tax=Paenibacillus sp. PK3_47 TaxID=2072642 RepID=UPI00201D78F3|nr:hypothetical protein [Paenibacillus sp. PK3_47]UQZ35394.1 hypothetical protein C2I18_18830 [Paenibacillus sp. PK3_47]